MIRFREHDSHSPQERRSKEEDPETPLSSSDEEEEFQRTLDNDWEQSSIDSGLTAQLEPRRPLDYFRPKVDALVRQLQDQGLFPPTRIIHVIPMTGNIDYRMFQITLDAEHSRVLRVARHSTQDIRPTTRMLCWLSANTTLPVPTPLHRDRTSNNPLGRPYILTSQVSGVSLASVYHTMTVEQRTSIAAEVAKLIFDVASVPAPAERGSAFIDDSGALAVQAAPPQLPPVRASLPLKTMTQQSQQGPALRPRASIVDVLKRSGKRFQTTASSETAAVEPEAGRPSAQKSSETVKTALLAPHVPGQPPTSSARQSAPAAALVLSHPGLDPHNIFVQLVAQRSNQDWPCTFRFVWTITSIVFWDDCRVVPEAEAFSAPAYLTERPCTNTQRCRFGCKCVGNDDLTPNLAATVRQHFEQALQQLRSQATENRDDARSLSSRIKQVLCAPFPSAKKEGRV
ncbi:hypothetical protein OC834_005246 [Tilletia horrida]|nr:hypothetical protein OC834_005246 [Tilletia horrida]